MVFAIFTVFPIFGLSGCKAGETSEKDDAKGDGKMVFQPVVAGQFYDSSPTALKNEVDHYISRADIPKIQGRVVGIISPHAGYVYSGPVAGFSFKAVKGRHYDTVVVMGVSHRVPGSIGVLNVEKYKTPLGELTLDQTHSQNLINAAPWIEDNEKMFSMEHSMEVELPFIQRALGNPKIVMISMRTQKLSRLREFAKILYDTFDKGSTLFVASTDMSHFHTYDEAKAIDLNTLNLIQSFDIEALSGAIDSGKSELCGAGPVLTLLEIFRLQGGTEKGVHVLKYMNSGDTAGDKNRVVGYGSVVLATQGDQAPEYVEVPPEQDAEDYISAQDKKMLLTIARKTIETYLSTGKSPDFDITSDTLKKPGAAFVTLHKTGQLRGCIGQIIPTMPLWKCVREMAVAAATQDPRFSKVRENEVPELHLEISVLTPPKVCEDPNMVRVGRHGLIISRGFYRGLLLPQVPTEWNWDREAFLSQTCRKAGLESDCWKDPKTKIETFEAIVFSE